MSGMKNHASVAVPRSDRPAVYFGQVVHRADDGQVTVQDFDGDVYTGWWCSPVFHAPEWVEKTLRQELAELVAL